MTKKNLQKIVSTITCGFRGVVAKDRTKEERETFIEAIDRIVLVVSRLRHEASWLANYILLLQCEKENVMDWDIHLADEKRWQQFYRACLKKVQQERSGKGECSHYRTKLAKYLKFINAPFSAHESALREWEADKQVFPSMPDHFLELKRTKKDKQLSTEAFEHKLSEERETYEALLFHPFEFASRVVCTARSYADKKAKMENELEDYKKRIRSTNYINALPGWPASEVDYKTELKGLGKVFDIVASEMATNAMNGIIFNFEKRQLKTLRLDFPDIALASKMAILINCSLLNYDSIMLNWESRCEPAENDTKKQALSKQKRSLIISQLKSLSVIRCIQTHRRVLRANQTDFDNSTINGKFIEQHSSLILHYFCFLNRCNERERKEREQQFQEEKEIKAILHPNPKGEVKYQHRKLKCQIFNLLPVHHYRRFFLQLQTKLLCQISATLEVKLSEDEIWDYWFDLSHLRNQSHLLFDNNIKTDGIKACVLFTNHKTKKGKSARKVAALQHDEDAADDKKKEVKRVVIQPGTRGMFKDKEVKLDQSIFETNNPFRLLSVDPGRLDIVSCYDSSQTGKAAFRHMSRGEYFHHRKTHVFARRREYHWKAFVLEHPEVKLDEQCFRTTASRDYLAACKSRMKVEETIWSFYGLRRNAKWAFEMSKAKQRTHVLINKRILGNKSNIPAVIAYGNGKFPTSGPGQASTPLSSISRNLSHYATIVMTDEYNTSKVCPDCKKKTLEKNKLTFYCKTRWMQLKTKTVGRQLRKHMVDGRKMKWKRARLKEPRQVNCLRHVYEHVSGVENFRMLGCTTHCTKMWIKHRDHAACLNIAEACMEELVHGRRPLILQRPSSNGNLNSSVQSPGRDFITSHQATSTT